MLSFGLVFSTYAGNQWQEGTGENTILGTINPSDIDKDSYENVVDPLDRVLTNYQEGCKMTYASASTITVGSGEIMLSNAAGTIKLMQLNTSSTTVTWSDIDTGAEASSTTYYLYAYQATVTDTDFDVAISTSSSAPTGIIYYAKLGSFYNDGSSNILNDETITNENNYYALQLGDWVSKSVDTAYLASTDGFFIGLIAQNSGTPMGHSIKGFTDSSNPPTTARGYAAISSAENASAQSKNYYNSFCIPIKAGDYYKVTYSNDGGNGTATRTYYWIPNE